MPELNRIIIADDHALVRKGLRQLIEETYPHCVITEVGSAEDLMVAVIRQQWDVVITDVSMPGRNGIEALQQIKALHPQLPVLVLSIYAEEQYALRAMKAGASGYLTKDSAPEELVLALEKIRLGRKYINQNIADLMAASLYDQKPGGKESLSERELQVLIQLGQGKSNKEIAASLHISLSSISTYRNRILEKLNLRNNSDITRFCVEEGLL